MKYLDKRGAVRPILGLFDRNRNYHQAVVIPALGEAEHLPLTIQSLYSNRPENVLRNTLVLVVVNNRPSETGTKVNQGDLKEQIDNNTATLQWLESLSRDAPLPLAWIDASSPGNELPPWGGVGLARKIGCDSILSYLLEFNRATVLKNFVFFSLDADALVSTDYLETAGYELRSTRCAGGTIPFKHQKADSAEGQAAIDAYEDFLHYYVDGLRWAGSPYAFHTIGSCLCFTADGYFRANGFPARRQAGEDFYFCMELAKTSGICEIQKAMVYPSARISHRVPFGTGRHMAEAILNGKRDFPVYDFQVFIALRDLINTVSAHSGQGANEIFALLKHPATEEFLEMRGFPDIWHRFQRQHKTRDALLTAFHHWFDGFVTLKYIHWLSDKEWPRRPLEEISHANSHRSHKETTR
ncbi:MAG: hypothetical protein ABFD82_21185 [Syntrophaceae bacterium]